jgi:osmotically-inducible protein OsmY
MTARTQRIFVLLLAAATSACANANVRAAADDANIAASVEAALDTYPSIGETSSIQVQSIDHVVYLHGLVDTYPEKLLVQSVAAKLPGVDRVVNSLELHNE